MCQNHSQSQASVGNTSNSTIRITMKSNSFSEENTMDRTTIITKCQENVRNELRKYADTLGTTLVNSDFNELDKLILAMLNAAVPTVCEECGQSDRDMLEDGKCDGCFTKCESCDDIICREDALEATGGDYCEHCAVRCRECSDVTPIQDADWCGQYEGHLDTDNWYCQDCGAECHECGEVELREDMAVHDNNDEAYFCEACSTECDRCSDRHGDEFMTEVDGDHYCRDCVDDAQTEYANRLQVDAFEDIKGHVRAAIMALRPDMGEQELNEKMDDIFGETYDGMDIETLLSKTICF